MNTAMELITDLRKIPLFTGLSEAALERLQARLRTRRFAEGEVILRSGDPANEMYVIVQGAARVELDAGSGRAARRALLGAGQTVGEMSVLTGAAVSVTVIAQRDTTTYALGRDELSRLLDEEPALYRALVTLLTERLRHRTQSTRLRPAVVGLELCGDPAAFQPLVEALSQGIKHYAPGSLFYQALDNDPAPALHQIDRWRDEGAGEQFLIVVLPPQGLAAIRDALVAGDAALRIVSDIARANVGALDAGLADAQTVLWESPRARGPGPWMFSVSHDEIVSWSVERSVWDRSRYPTLDHIARYVTFREIGVAMSIGAAAGFAHLGFLEVLEDAGVPIDFLCGSSMGGVVALGFAQFGKAQPAAHAICKLGMEFAKARGFQVIPRSGFLSRHRIEAVMTDMFGARTFSELQRPVTLIAADLVAGDRVILDTGPIAEAARATSAIPGLFPPVRIASRILVDGGLVTRVPADLLARRRCGLRLAAVARSELPATSLEREAEADHLQKRLDQPFGLRAVLGASWKLLGWWDSAAQAQKADLVVNIGTPSQDGFNFAAGATMVECGRVATQRHIEAIRQAVNRVLTPGMP